MYYSGNESYLFVSKALIFKIKAHGNMPWYKFCLGSMLNDFTKEELIEVPLNGAVYDLSVDYSPVRKEDILNIHKKLIKKNNIK